MQKTKIQWTDATWNPVLGCRRVSPGCEHCYAERLIAFRMSRNPKLPMYHDIARVTAGVEPRFTGEHRLIPDRLDEPLRARQGRKIFVCDMGDLFFEGHTFEEIAAVWGVMAAAKQHTFQVLTKRPGRALEWFAWLDGLLEESRRGYPGPVCHAAGLVDFAERLGGPMAPATVTAAWPLSNVWLGVSVEDQRRADERIPLLLRCPSVVRFLSVEPMLEGIDIQKWLGYCPSCDKHGCVINDMRHSKCTDPAGLWVICGGESGPGARPFDLVWARSLRDQCAAAGVPYFLKQIGANPRVYVTDPDPESAGVYRYPSLDPHGGDPAEWPAYLRVREFPAVPS